MYKNLKKSLKTYILMSASDLTESFYNACRGTFLFLRRFLRLISTPKNLYKYKENHCGVQLLFRLCSA